MSLRLEFISTDPHQGTEIKFYANAGTVTVICGASGRGKSTLLSQIWGSRSMSTKGHVIIHSNDQFCDLTALKPAHLAQLRQRFMHYVGQNPSVLKRDFVSSWFDSSDQRLAHGLAAFDLSQQLLERRAGEVSGGELQRFILLRAVLSDAPILLLDEPFTGLDVMRIEKVGAFLCDEAKRDRTIILTSHQKLGYGEQCILLP